MARSLANDKDIQAVNEALQGNSKGIIKLGKKTYIRILSMDYEAEFVHFVGGKAVVCLGDYEKDKGYNPDVCPTCAKVKNLWEKYNEAKNAGKKEKMKDVLKEIQQIQSKHQIVLIAVQGNVETAEDDDGELKTKVVWEKEAKILKLSPAQWKKLTETVFETYEYMKTSKDLANRNLFFTKESKSGKDGQNDYTEVQIKPSKKKTSAPEVENDHPDLSEMFNHASKKEMLDLLKSGAEDAEVVDEDLEADVEEDPKKEKKTAKKTEKKETKKPAGKAKKAPDPELEDDDEPDFVKDDMGDSDTDGDDDVDDGDDDYDDFDDD